MARWGRISLRTLIQNCNLTAKQVYHSLTVLIQQHLVLHHTPAASPSYYEVDWNGAYNLVRSGKVVSTVETRLGAKAAHVASSLLQLGHAKVSDLERAFKFGKPKGVNHTVANGLAPAEHGDTSVGVVSESNKVTTTEELHDVLWQLIQSRFVTRVHARSYLSTVDKQNEIEDLVKEQEFPGGKVTGPKARLAFDNMVTARKRRWEEEDCDVSGFIQHSNKRAKTNGHSTNGSAGMDGVVLNGDLVLRVNFDRCAVAMRSDRLAQHAQRCLGETTARVYEAFLHVVEGSVKHCKPVEQYKGIDQNGSSESAGTCRATTMDVLENLEHDPEALEMLDIDDTTANGAHEHKRLKKRKLDDSSSISTLEQRNHMLKEIETHLLLLAEHEIAFVERLSSRGMGEYTISFDRLTTTVRDYETEAVVCARFGTVAARMIRLLKRKGKLDEKQICAAALLRLKDVRTVLDAMLDAGFVEAQEIPKDNTRQPSRALYLWYFDQPRVESLLLERNYVAMSRCLQRVATQRDRVRTVIEKAERTDVVGHEDEFLTKADKVHLRAWREQEEKLLGQVARMDETVALLRDY